MHSRKSIFYKGIVFVASIFAMAIFSFTKADAACEVQFVNGSQYVTLAGNLKGWNNPSLELVDCEGASEFGIEEVKVNGSKTGLDSFVAQGREPGHYTVEYQYKYKKDSNEVKGSILRYIQILSSFNDNSDNYTLGVFKGSATLAVEVIESFYAGNNRFVNVLKNTKYDVDGNVVSTTASIVLTDQLSRTIASQDVKYTIESVEYTVNVVKAFQINNVFYLVGNNNVGKGVVLTYGLSGDILSSSEINFTSQNAMYNSATVSQDGENVYGVGKNASGYPVVEVYNKTTEEVKELYVYYYTKENAPSTKIFVPGEYMGVAINGNNIYAVGYTKEANQLYTQGLYTELNVTEGVTATNSTILQDLVDTKFYDITNTGVTNIVVGSTKQSIIYVGGSALENVTGTDNAIVLQFQTNNTRVIENALMYGGNNTDAFYRIKNFGNEYIVSGVQGTTGLVVSFKADLTEAKDVLTDTGNYKLNGATKWDNGYVYYGAYDDQVDSSKIIKEIYYPFDLDGKTDGLLLVFDQRVINGYKTEVIQLRKESAHDYSEFPLNYGNSGPYYAGTGEITTTQLRESIEYYTISLGRVIYVYRDLHVVESINAEFYPLTTQEMGILKWYLYNRGYTYIQDNGKRLETSDFNYRISATEGLNSISTVEEMIRYYLQTGNTQGYSLNYILNASEGVSQYTKVDQTKAAFATSEYAKMYAYYQELGRVVRLDGTKDYRSEYGAYAYPGAEPVKGQAYYIYYIDYRGANASNDVTSCNVGAGRVTNCANKGGYAFNNLNSIKTIIENLLKYANHFMTVKNYIYEKSSGVEAAQLAYYSQPLTTKEYVKTMAITTQESELSLKVEATGLATPVSKQAKNLYFGGSINEAETVFTYNDINYAVEKVLWENNGTKNIYYYEASNAVFFLENLCYKVYYSSGETNGSAKEFCLDTKAPEIMYRKEGSDKIIYQSKESIAGTVVGNPLRIEKNFQIVGLKDLDEYAYIRANGQVYTLACTANSSTGEKSQECLDNANQFIYRAFKYDLENPMGVKSITFADRLGNSNTFYFVVGTDAPHISIPRYDKTGFTLVIDFYKTNPITSITTEIYQQMCSASAGDNCYTPGGYENENPISDTNVHKQFTEALQNYIRAISYRDAGDIEATLTVISDENGAYTFVRMVDGEERSIKYVIEDGYFVESEGYQEKLITLNENNIFTYNNVVYAYDTTNAKICLAALNGDNYELDCTPENEISLQQGVFKFEPDGKDYKLVESESGITIEVLPQKYEIDENNKFEIEKSIYTIDYDLGVITYENPLLATMKHIELDFTRTVIEGNTLSGGVNIPNTKPYCGEKVDDSQCDADKALIDASTNLPMYVLVGDDSYTHFDLVDGLYKFTISQLFSPYSETARATLNVKDLNISLGIHKNQNESNPLDHKTGVDLKYDIEDDIYDDTDPDDVKLSAIAMSRVDGDSFMYPLMAESIFNKATDLANTRFVPQTVYADLQMDALGELVFSIEVCNVDLFASKEDCKTISIYGSAYDSYDNSILPLQADYMYPMNNVDNTELEDLGVAAVVGPKGTFAFFKQRTFYSISVSHWTWRNESFEPDNEAIQAYKFYLDTMKPNSNDPQASDKNTVSATVYDGDVSISAEFPFVGNPNDGYSIDAVEPDGEPEANNTIGGSKNVHFSFNWEKESTKTDETDHRENQLLMMTVSDKTCNVYYLIQAAKGIQEYDTECLKYIDVDETKKNTNTIVFSATGQYTVTFKDASQNAITYTFEIDKQAPDIIAIGATMNGMPIDKLIPIDRNQPHTLMSFVKNPEFSFFFMDNSVISSYCYYFELDNGLRTVGNCPTGFGDVNSLEVRISLTDDKLQGDSIYENLAHYLQETEFDGNIVLHIYGKDNLDNGGENDETKVQFWADYKAPTANAQYEETGDAYLNASQAITPEHEDFYHTIAVKVNDYSFGTRIECLIDLPFEFSDPRDDKLYEFEINSCLDNHVEVGEYYDDKYPNTLGFYNGVHLKFYKATDKNTVAKDGFNKPMEFEFIAQTDTQWMAIAIVDSVGNETIIDILPVFVQDAQEPSVVEVYKKLENGQERLLNSIEYDVFNKGEVVQAYLANSNIKVVFDERIKEVVNCKVYQNRKDTPIYTGCAPADGYEYTDNQTYLEFIAPTDGSYTIWVFSVADFATNVSTEIIVVIDRQAPVVDFRGDNPSAALDTIIEYKTDSTRYAEAYQNREYEADVYMLDDQLARVSMAISYQRYLPSVTYNNYKKNNDGTFTFVPNGQARTGNLYLKLKQELVENKYCVAQEGGYCYVEDSSSTYTQYYFKSRLTLEDPSEQVWSSRNLTEINNSVIGVYRIRYQVTDAAGNVSEYLYKNVFVNDSINPDVDIYSINNKEVPLYTGLAGATPDPTFNGKLNQIVSFKGTTYNASDRDTRIRLYSCNIESYYRGLCDINQPLYNPVDQGGLIIGKPSTTNELNMGFASADGVYKIFVYDIGQYKVMDDGNVYEGNEEPVYALTHNVGYFYFALQKSEITAQYHVYGNKYNSDYNGKDGKGFTYHEDTSNFYMISKDGEDVYLVGCPAQATSISECVSLENNNSIGFNSYELIPEGSNIKAVYKDVNGKVVYEVIYSLYSAATETKRDLYLHETYYRIDLGSQEITLCRMQDGRNMCATAGDGDIYKISRVTAYIRDEEASQKWNFRIADRFGNLSPDKGELVVDNTPYFENKNNTLPTGINYWFSVPKKVLTQNDASYFVHLQNNDATKEYNALDPIYNGNFNSDFFYAFASRSDAVLYLRHIYEKEIEKQLASGFVFYNTKGEQYTYDSTNTVQSVMESISESLSKMVYKTYVKTDNFSSPAMAQIAYNSKDLGTSFAESISMYEYVYLIYTKSFVGGIASWTIDNYEIKNTCEISDPDNQMCVRVDLKIVDPSNPGLNITKSAETNKYICISRGGGGTDRDCSDNLNVVPNGAVYVFIDADINKAYHTNYTYYGVTAYSESAEINYTELGMYVPISDRYIARYSEDGDNYKVDANGDFVWVDSEFKKLSSLINTNLYKDSCSFNGKDYDSCLYVTYFSRYVQAINQDNESFYKPSANGEFYYNYYTGTYMEKNQLIAALNENVTFIDNKLVVNTNQKDVAIVKSSTNQCVNGTNCTKTINVITNKKTYVELFNYSSSDEPSKLFEIQKTPSGEIYSYATLIIGGSPVNINNYIYVDAAGNYRCLIDIPMNTDTIIVVRDRAKNEITINISHNSIIPTLKYEKDGETTDSSVSIKINTTSEVTNLVSGNVKVYKYDMSEAKYVEYKNYTCYSFSTEMENSFKSGYVQFAYSSSVDCQGVYKVQVTDQHGNSKYIEFVYNPYILDTTYNVDAHSNVHKYEEDNKTGAIVDTGFKFEVNSKLNYAIISRYKPYSNLSLNDDNLIETITIKDFANANGAEIGSCKLTVIQNGSLHVVSIASTTNNDCDGVYVVTIVNRFSQEVIKNNLNYLEGAYQEEITHVVTYESITSMEIDSKAPVTTNQIEPYFNLQLYVHKINNVEKKDYVTNVEDTKTIISQQTIAYTNEYVRIVWGGSKEHSLAYMQYRIYSITEGADSAEWVTFEDNIVYSGSYSVSKEFKLVQAGTYVCEFTFVDAVGNSDTKQIYTINLIVEAPDAKFFEIKDTNPDAIYYISENKYYAKEERIATDVFLKCSKDGNAYKACGPDEYDYLMYINSTQSTGFNNLASHGSLSSPIGVNSFWLGVEIEDNSETIFTLAIRVKGKPDIETVLSIIVDKKAPDITIPNTPYPGTTMYTGSVTVNISSEDSSNTASIYKCHSVVDNVCMVYDAYNKKDIPGDGELIKEIKGLETSAIIDSSYSGHFLVIAKDNLGNESRHSFTLDNEAPTITVTTEKDDIVAHNMYTNSKSVYVKVNDELSSQSSTRFEIEFTPLNGTDTVTDYVSTAGFTKEGKYVLTPIDSVGLTGRPIVFYIYRQAPAYNIETDQGENAHIVNKEAKLTWVVSESELVAPIVNITVDGAMYEAEYNSNDKKYTGKVINNIGNHTFVITDAAGNTSIAMVTINNTSKVCINGIIVDVKMHAYYKTDELFIGSEPGVRYEVDDVIIFALPSQSGGNSDCESQNLLSYQTLDPENSHYLITSQKNANVFNTTEEGVDFKSYGFISQAAINEINSVGGTVAVFVVTKDIANNQLGYTVGTNFFMEDPVGWVMIFAFAGCCIIPTYRIFVKKKVRVI